MSLYKSIIIQRNGTIMRSSDHIRAIPWDQTRCWSPKHMALGGEWIQESGDLHNLCWGEEMKGEPHPPYHIELSGTSWGFRNASGSQSVSAPTA